MRRQVFSFRAFGAMIRASNHGSGTFELQVMATDLDAYARFSVETLLNLPNVKDIHTRFSLGEVKAAAALPLEHLRGPRG